MDSIVCCSVAISIEGYMLCNIISNMEEQPVGSQTLYIKFPTVTKLQYPIELIHESSTRSPTITSYRQNFLRNTKSVRVFSLSTKTDSFKIIRLPRKEDIMNICAMPVRNKEQERSEEREQSADKKARTVFNINKLVGLKAKLDIQSITFKNPFKMKKVNSQKEAGNAIPKPQISFDYFQVYPEVLRLIALSFGVTIAHEEGSRIRRGKIDFSNNGFLVKQILKRRLWWNAVCQQQQSKGEFELSPQFIWTTSALPPKQAQKIKASNELCFVQERYEAQAVPFAKKFQNVLNQMAKVKQLFFTEWQQQPLRLRDWLQKMRNKPILKVLPFGLTINNHLANSQQITNKKLLFRNMVDYYNRQGKDPYEFIPKTYHITCFNWQQVIQEVRGQENVWILKPGQFTNRGRGISVFRSTKDALDYLLVHPPRTQEKTYLLQQYINPLLYEQRKFDIRCYMLGVQVDKTLKFYMYQQGYIRTASEKFTTKKVSKSIHLTNDAIQKNMPNYDKFQSANKLSYHQLDKYCLNNTTFNFYAEILPEIKRISRNICCAVGDERLIGNRGGISFELFGLDYLVDARGKPWLCEVNTNPSLEICCSLLSRIIPEMLQNTFRLVNDVFLPARKTPEYAQHFLTTNKYSLIYSDDCSQLCP